MGGCCTGAENDNAHKLHNMQRIYHEKINTDSKYDSPASNNTPTTNTNKILNNQPHGQQMRIILRDDNNKNFNNIINKNKKNDFILNITSKARLSIKKSPLAIEMHKALFDFNFDEEIKETDEVSDIQLKTYEEQWLQSYNNSLEETFSDSKNQYLSLDEISQSLNEKYINHKFSFIQSAVYSKMGKPKKTNQDSYFIFDSFNLNNEKNTLFQFYGVCDGHGTAGDKLSQFVCYYLPRLLKGQPLNENAFNQYGFIPNLLLTDPKIAIKIAFEILEELLSNILASETNVENELNLKTVDINYSGTTVVCGLRIGDKLYIANVGDSRAVLGRTIKHGGKDKIVSLALSEDHDAINIEEVIRIEQSQYGRIALPRDSDDETRIEINLINVKHASQLTQKISSSVSRSIGDRIAHVYGGLISVPQIIVHEMVENDLFVIFASDGVWQTITNTDIMRMIGHKLLKVRDEKVYENMDSMTQKIVREANILWSDEYEEYVDDITVVIARIGENIY